MTQNIGFARLAALIGVAVTAAVGAPVVHAAKKPAAAVTNQASGKSAFEAGQKAFVAGKYQPAVDQFSTALRIGGLSSADMAKTLYLRGLSYKRLNKPGLAISDLTSALWLKEGLSESDRKTATAERVDAYKAAGLSDAAGNVANVDAAATAPAPTTAVALAAAPAAAAPTPTAASPAPIVTSGGVTRQSPDSEAARDAARMRAAAANPVDVGGVQAAAVATVLGQPASAPPAPAAPVDGSTSAAVQASMTGTQPAASPPAPSDTGTTAGGFFANLFGGSSNSASAGSAVTTASTGPTQPQTSSWSDSTSVTSGAKSARQSAAAAPAAQPAAPAKKQAKKGKYKAHIAALRSRSEAEALAQKLAQALGTELGDHAPTVDEAVIGSMGTFYRVRIGGYVSQAEPSTLCGKLRSSGYDCLVVTN